MFHIVSFTFEESEVSEITSETVVRVKLNILRFSKPVFNFQRNGCLGLYLNVMVIRETHKLHKEAVHGISHTSARCAQTLLTGKHGLTSTGETGSGKKSYGKVPMLTDATPLSGL